MLETEVKIPCETNLLIENPAGIRFTLNSPRHFEDNWLFDFGDGKLRTSHCALRLRIVGQRGWLTFKAAPEEHRWLKIREETEVEFEQPERMRKILLALGLTTKFRYQKFRTTYTITLNDGQQLEAMFDETPMGNFLEIEGDGTLILQAIEQLSVSSNNLIRASYPTLWMNFIEKNGMQMQDMVFPPAP